MGIGTSDVMALRSAILQRNSALLDVASPSPATSNPGLEGVNAPKGSFASAFQGALQKVNTLQEQEDVATEAYERGEITDIATVAIIQQRASISFEATLQVRNKLMSAYKDIMNMPV